jgi:hypothetical protein
MTPTLATRGNLAGALEEAGRVEESIEQYQALPADCQRVLKPDRPRVWPARFYSRSFDACDLPSTTGSAAVWRWVAPGAVERFSDRIRISQPFGEQKSVLCGSARDAAVIRAGFCAVFGRPWRVSDCACRPRLGWGIVVRRVGG